ncbi:MAG: pentapeptide repeat-containing protein, partial [Leptolyngbyaceae cyanobacterium]
MKGTNKYHGQRLGARDVLRLYALGERNFCSAILSGCNFRGADLSEANFGKADIRGTCFAEATLQGTNFCYAKSGYSPLWWMVIQAAPYIIGVLCGTLQGFFAVLIGGFLGYGPSVIKSWADLDVGVTERLIAMTAAFAIVLPAFLIIEYQGFTLKALKGIAITVIGVSVIAISTGGINVSGVIAGLLTCIVAITSVIAGGITSINASANPFSVTFLFTAFIVASIGVMSAGHNASDGSIILSFLIVIAQLSSQSVCDEVRAREMASKAEMPCRLAVFTRERTWANSSGPQS